MSRSQEFDTGYRGEHQAPGPDYGSPMHDVTLNGTYPEDYYSSNGPRYYGDSGGDTRDLESMGVASGVRGKPDSLVRAYRAVPKATKGAGNSLIQPGDWVTTSRSYAQQHGRGPLNGDYRVVSRLVPAKHLWTDGNSVHEWGYHPNS